MNLERRLFQGIAVALLVGVCWWAVTVYISARRLKDYSAQRGLMAEAVMLLEEHFRQHGRYPASLNSLAFTFPDGGDSSTLATLHYHSDGETYEITAKSAVDGEEIHEPPLP